jgi:ATP-dependent Zn protease
MDMIRNLLRVLGGWVLGALLLALFLLLLLNIFPPTTEHSGYTQIAYSDLISEMNRDRVRDVVIQGRTLWGQLTDGRMFQSYTPEAASYLIQQLTDKGVRVIAKPEDADVNPLLHYFLVWLPTFLVVGVWVVETYKMRKLVRQIANQTADMSATLSGLLSREQPAHGVPAPPPPSGPQSVPENTRSKTAVS